MKRFFAITCIIALTLGLMLVSCQKKEEAAAPAPAAEKAVEQAAPAAPAEQKPAETGGYGEKKPAAGGYGEEKKAEEPKH
jgi:uncharacterized lipoprotein YbaY